MGYVLQQFNITPFPNDPFFVCLGGRMPDIVIEGANWTI
jgi:hypothetical protein